MTALKSALSLLICIALCGFALSCSNGRPPIPVGPLVINPAALPAAVVNVAYSTTLTSIGGKGPFTWALASGTLPPGLTISTGGVISGTPTTLGSNTFKVSVTDSQTPTAAVDIVTETITVNPPLSITTTSPLTAGAIGVPYTASLAAAGGVSPYTWSITSGTLPAGLTLSSTGLISGTPTNQETQSFTVQVSDSQTPPANATANLSLTINGPTGRLNGNYVFSFSGYQNGNQVLQAGSFTADGAGNITNGLMDSNSAAGVHTSLTFTGTYSLDSTNTGPMTLIIPPLGTFTYQVAAPATGTIRFIQNGTAGNQGSGVIRKNSSTTAITISQLAGFWSFGAAGTDAAANRYASAGTFQSSTTGAWSNIEIDANDDGSTSHSTSLTGAFTTINSVTGRGTATLTVTGGSTTNYSFYPVSASEIIMVSVDPVSSTSPLQLFSLATRAQNNYTNSALNTTTVAALQGVGSANSSPAPYGLLGFVTFDGAGNLTVSTDENLGGTLSAHNYTGTYSVASNGRTVLTGFGSNPVIFYLSNAIAFTLEDDSAVTAGTIVPQSRSTFDDTTFSGSYQGGSLQAVLPSVTVEADSGNADGNGNLALLFDTSGPGGPQQGLTSAITYAVDSKGRAPLITNGNTVGIMYVVVATGTGAQGTVGKVVVLTTNANPTINDWEK
jgi:hypothetical protein